MKLRVNFLYALYFKQPSQLTKWGLFKFGFSCNVTERVNDIAASIEEKTGRRPDIRCFIKIPLISAKVMERFFHNKMAGFRSNRIPYQSSGYTEWFDYINVVSALLFYWTVNGYVPAEYHQAVPALSLIITFLPWPIDFALFGAAFMAIELIVVNLVIKAVTGFSIISAACNLIQFFL